jgi:hypothetical protein
VNTAPYANILPTTRHGGCTGESPYAPSHNVYSRTPSIRCAR